MMSMIGRQMGEGKGYSQEEMDFARAVKEIEQAVLNVHNYRKALMESPSIEMRSMLNALDGGYTAPSPGGDPVANPNTLPTGRNLFAVNAEATPTRSAWEKGVALAENTLRLYRERHCDSLPRKVSYTLWSSEFIETEGATIGPSEDRRGGADQRPAQGYCRLSSFPDRQGCPYGSGGQGRRI